MRKPEGYDEHNQPAEQSVEYELADRLEGFAVVAGGNHDPELHDWDPDDYTEEYALKLVFAVVRRRQ